MRAIASLVVATLLGSALCGPDRADAKDGSREDRHAARAACEADIKGFCSDITPGGGRVMLCVRAHDDKVSKPCRDALDKLRADRKAERGDAS